MNIKDVIRKVERLVSAAHATASAEPGSLYSDIKGPQAEDKAMADLRAAIEAYGAECAKAERERWTDVVFDGWRVLKALGDAEANRTTHQNVSDTLDALMRVIRWEQSNG
jgi:accessory colonization factor AcfC